MEKSHTACVQFNYVHKLSTLVELAPRSRNGELITAEALLGFPPITTSSQGDQEPYFYCLILLVFVLDHFGILKSWIHTSIY